MKKFLIVFFVVLGVVALIGVLIGIGFFLANQNGPAVNSENTSSTGVQADGGFSLSDAQKSALQAFGIDISTIPSYITPQQEACFVAALGADRVAEIKGGAVPNAIDFFKAKACIQ